MGAVGGGEERVLGEANQVHAGQDAEAAGPCRRYAAAPESKGQCAYAPALVMLVQVLGSCG